MPTDAGVVETVRTAARATDAVGRADLLRDVVRAIYDVEKLEGAGGEGLDGRDSRARQTFAKVADAAEASWMALRPAH